ncbi:MAG: HEAT repeat domain-containing protein [Elusimicrobia bacterium]|nr:HEAT repeat domain-containing protein [Elusimicrobiota bacterium]
MRKVALLSVLMVLTKPLGWTIGAEVKIQPPPIQEDPVPKAISDLKNPDLGIRRQAIEKLLQFRDPRSIPALLDSLRDENAMIRAAAVDVLGLLRAREASGSFAQLLLKDPSPQVRQVCAISLAYLRDPLTVPSLIEALQDSSEGVRLAAARTLGLIKTPEALKPLLKLLQDKNLNMRRSAITALGELGMEEAIPSLENYLADPDILVRQEVARSLGRFSNPKSESPLKKLLKDKEPSVSLEAALSLAGLQNDAGLEAALGFLKDSSPGIRQKAAGVLGLVGDKEKAPQALKESLKEEKDPQTKQLIEFNLNQLRNRYRIKEENGKTKK